jgi:adenosylcobinamide-phosphate synthase
VPPCAGGRSRDRSRARREAAIGLVGSSVAFHLSTPLIFAAVVLDWLLGDPAWLPHPVRLIGAAITAGERRLWRGTPARDLRNGAILTAVIVAGAALTAYLALAISARFGELFGRGAALALAFTTLSLNGLDAAAAEVERALGKQDLNGARRVMPALVGRDPETLDGHGIVRATVESVAENACDGVIAPLVFLAVAGPVGAIAYKAVNTLDSMIGHRDERYLYFGRCAARLDDLVNYLPARITALCLIVAAGLCRKRARAALAAVRADAPRHPSPNAGYPEAAMAGALGIQLGGPAVYGGEREERPPLGVAERNPTVQDIRAARSMLYLATALCLSALATARWALGALGCGA